MERLEVIYGLQKTIEQLYHEMDSFEINIKEILSLITAKRLITDTVLQRTIEQLGSIRELGKTCKEEYCRLEMSEKVPEYIEQIRITVTATERLLKEREEYFLAKEEFLQLYSDREELEKSLVIYQKELSGYKIEHMKEEEVKLNLEKYVLFMKAWREKEALKLIDYVQKLMGFFEKELVVAAVLQKKELILKDKKKEILEEKKVVKEPIKLIQQEETTTFQLKESKETLLQKEENFKDSKPKISKLKKMQQKREKQNIEQKEKTQQKNLEREKSLNVIQQKFEQEKGKNTETSSKKYIVKIESCIKKEKKKFGVKSFRNDLSGLTEGLKKRIFRGIRQYGGITVEFITAITKRREEEVKKECETLFSYGYLRQYKIEGMETLYSVSPKGKKAFELFEALHFLRIKVGLSDWETLEETKDIGSAVAVRLMLLKAITREFQKRDIPDIQIEHQIKQNVFFLKCKSFEQKEWRYYAGASEWIQDEKIYIQWLKQLIEEQEIPNEEKETNEKRKKLEKGKINKKWIVLGDLTYGERLKELIIKAYEEKIDPESILFQKYEEELIKKEETNNDNLTDKALIIKEAAITKEPIIVNKTKDIASKERL